MWARRGRSKWSSISALILTVLIVIFLHRYGLGLESWEPANFGALAEAKVGDGELRTDVELVVASTSYEDTSWLHRFLPEWKKNIYIVDDPLVNLTLPMNKGREAMVYLTYIIDRYDSLPPNILFLHAERFQWHNDDPDYDGLPLLRRFLFSHLQAEGYVNLRCAWIIGCPSEIKPFAHLSGDHLNAMSGENEEDKVLLHQETAKTSYAAAYAELFPDMMPVPEEVGVSCCAQFGVTREAVRRRPRKDYIRYRDWLVQTELSDDTSGRVFEYSWHMIFGKDPVYCPSAEDCYCKLYGFCDLECEDEGTCSSRYVLPKYSSMPKGWPLIGFNKMPRKFSGPL